jgi:hypothetical protein
MERGHAACERQSARCGDADAHAGEGAGSDRDGDEIERRDGERRLFHHRRHHRHQRLGVPPLHRREPTR